MKSVVPLTTDSSLTGDKASGTAVVSANRRLGPYDKEIELFRNGQIVDTFLHDLLPGDSFCTKDNPQLWLYVTGNMKSWTDRHGHLNFRMDGMEVLQARPTVDRTAVSAPKKETPKQLGHNDVDDVDFKES